jgi:hypothetical protein
MTYRYGFTLLLAGLMALTLAHAQIPTFGSPRQQQRIELSDPATGVRRVITFTKRGDDDYDIHSVDVDTGASSSGVLRGEGQQRFSGDIFDTGRGAFRQIVVIEQGDAKFQIEQYDYLTDKRTRGRVLCPTGHCTYEALP